MAKKRKSRKAASKQPTEGKMLYDLHEPSLTPETAYEALEVISGELLSIAATLEGVYGNFVSYGSGEITDETRKAHLMAFMGGGVKICLDRVRHLAKLADTDWQDLPAGESKSADFRAKKQKSDEED